MQERIKGWLRWSERYTKTDMVYLAKGGFWLTLGQVFASGSGLVLSIFFANLLPPSVFGTYKYALSIAGILSICTLPGVWTALNQSVAKGFEGSLLFAQKIRMSWGALGSVACVIGALYYFYNANSNLGIALLIIGLFLPFTEPLNTYDAHLYGVKDFKTSTKYFVFSQLIATLVMIGALIATDNLFVIIIAYFLPWTLTRAYFTQKTLASLKHNNQVDLSLKSYGRHLSAISVLNTIAQHIDKVLVFHYLGAVELAIYSFAVAMPEQMKAVFKSIHTLALPKFASSDISSIRKTIYKKMLLFGLLVLIGILAYIIASPFIYKFLFPQYMESIKYSMIYSVSVLATVTSLPMAALTSHKKTKSLYIINISTSIIQIVGLGVLTALFGLLGAIWSRVLTRLISLIIQTYVFHRASEEGN